MKCPHCTQGIFYNPQGIVHRGDGRNIGYLLFEAACPECQNMIYEFEITLPTQFPEGVDVSNVPSAGRWYAWPRVAARVPLSKEVPEKYAEDYREACAVFPYSEKASAALSRRCLQSLLKDELGAAGKDLEKQIEDVLTRQLLRRDLGNGLHAVRQIGNFAAHPIKSTSTGEIVPVEPGEAEWSLDILEGLFDFLFVEPAAMKARKDALNKKLVDAGKPPLP